MWKYVKSPIFYLEAGTFVAILCVQRTYKVTWFLRIVDSKRILCNCGQVTYDDYIHVHGFSEEEINRRQRKITYKSAILDLTFATSPLSKSVDAIGILIYFISSDKARKVVIYHLKTDMYALVAIFEQLFTR